MFEGLQRKWKVSPLRLLLILVTFALGGSLTGYLGKKLMNLTGIESAVLYVPVYILIVTLLWPFMVLLVSIPFGQFAFFRSYLKKMGARFGMGKHSTEEENQFQPSVQANAGKSKKAGDKRQPGPNANQTLVIFASGAGSNAQKIIDHFRSSAVRIGLIVCNKPGAGVIRIAEKEGIPVLLIEKERFFRGDAYLEEINGIQPALLILAGFLWKVPAALIAAFPNRILNIHPALLPRYGGKGMYGNFVHEAVLAAGEVQSGITIHIVDDHYDSGDIIFQTACPVQPGDTPEKLAERIHVLEHVHYPRVIEDYLLRLTRNR